MYRSGFDYTMFKASSLSVVQPDAEDREAFLKEWEYDKQFASRLALDVSHLNRTKKEFEYFQQYSMDNVFELYVYKWVVTTLNKLADLRGKKQFTIGHHIPMALGGVHYPTNWTIQTGTDNSNAKDHMPENLMKPSWDEQFFYILDHMGEEYKSYKFVYLVPILLKLQEVY